MVFKKNSKVQYGHSAGMVKKTTNKRTSAKILSPFYAPQPFCDVKYFPMIVTNDKFI